MIRNTVPYIDTEEGVLPSDKVPTCPNCGGMVFGNVRGGDWYLHKPYDKEHGRFIEWLSQHTSLSSPSSSSLAIIEVGAGFNTPTVTRFPMESIARECKAPFVRINPSDANVPLDLERALALKQGWQCLLQLAALSRPLTHDNSSSSTSHGHVNGLARFATKSEQVILKERADLRTQPGRQPEFWRKFKHHHGHFDWRVFLSGLNR